MEILTTQAFKTKVFDFETNKTWNFKGDLPTIIDFYTDWCGPCRAMTPILEEIAEEYRGKIQVYKINTEVTPELAALFEVRSIPSILFIPKFEEPAMTVGFLSKENFKNAINDIFKI